MQFSKGIICRKLSRKYEFHESRLSDSCTSGHKWIFFCKFNIFWLNWVVCCRISPCNSNYNESDTLPRGINKVLPLLFTFCLVLIKCGTEDALAVPLSNYEVCKNWHSEWNILCMGINETLPLFFTSWIYMRMIPENQCLSSIHCKMREVWRTL